MTNMIMGFVAMLMGLLPNINWSFLPAHIASLVGEFVKVLTDLYHVFVPPVAAPAHP
jgi:hypothetical protein